MSRSMEGHTWEISGWMWFHDVPSAILLYYTTLQVFLIHFKMFIMKHARRKSLWRKGKPKVVGTMADVYTTNIYNICFRNDQITFTYILLILYLYFFHEQGKLMIKVTACLNYLQFVYKLCDTALFTTNFAPWEVLLWHHHKTAP